MKVLIGIPYATTIEPACFESVSNLERGGNDVVVSTLKGYLVDRERNQLAESAIKGGYDAIFYVDSDVVLPKDALINLIEPAVPVAHGMYCEKVWMKDGHFTQLHRFNAKTINYDKTTRLAPGDIKENRMLIKGGGAGCMLVRTEVFSKIEKPWFHYHLYNNGHVLSEDLWFSEQCRFAGVKVYADQRVKCGHICRETIWL